MTEQHETKQSQFVSLKGFIYDLKLFNICKG